MHFDYFLHPGSDPTFWVFVAFAIVVAIALFVRIPALIAKQLDARSDAIRNELEEARRLREEAQEMLASYQRKQREAEAEAEGIVAQAKKDAKALAATARTELAERIERRTAMAEARIAQAEAHAAAEVKALAADLAADAAAKLIADKGAKTDLKADLKAIEDRLN
ncbi:F0F1 ATP synthase subunit B family protein [Hyphobacterium marinum]|uniref:ATP synthase subunit b n=1 Tax=Hyphobacterium marinum TaxID=3116574 RepID=A0ABU7M131_9PROT|nr:F0F1 ATP synthase subunit B [Hyphobacterium sp. Y6023]MEE2567493.1 F0F1 ATP synthase subunit B [Hyphobacterium sp. Y6023]